MGDDEARRLRRRALDAWLGVILNSLALLMNTFLLPGGWDPLGAFFVLLPYLIVQVFVILYGLQSLTICLFGLFVPAPAAV